MVGWAPYLLNLFLDDCKDVQDFGTKFHYSWLVMLIAFMGSREPRYVSFATRHKQNKGAIYLLLGTTSDARHKNMNESIFERYLHDLEDATSNMWRITP
jgi:hypothetical protein